MTCDTCGGPIIKGNCYVYYSPDKKSKIHACPSCWERKVSRETREDFTQRRLNGTEMK